MGAAPSDMRVTVAVLEAGSFTAVGAKYGLSGSAVAKLVTRVEDHLGVKLVTRTTRKLALTSEGEIYLSRIRRILADIDDVEEEISANRSNPRGPIKVSCPNFFFLHQLAKTLPDFLDAYPNVQVEINIADRRLDLVSAGIDVAIRLGQLSDSTLVARKVCDLYRLICAAPRYLQKHGIPQTPGDLLRHECLFSTDVSGLDLWPFNSPNGIYDLKVSNRLALNDSEAVFQAGIAGLGIIRISDLLANEPMQRGELVPLLTQDHHSPPVPISLVMPPGRQRAARVSVFVDFFLERFSQAPWRAGCNRAFHPGRHQGRRAGFHEREGLSARQDDQTVQ